MLKLVKVLKLSQKSQMKTHYIVEKSIHSWNLMKIYFQPLWKIFSIFVEEQILSLVSSHAEGNHRSNTQSAPDREDYIWGWAQFLNLTSTCFCRGLCFAWTRIWWKMQQIQIFRYVCQVLVVGVFNQCQTRLLVHLIFLFNFLKEFWSGSNRTERGRNRKVLLQQIRF